MRMANGGCSCRFQGGRSAGGGGRRTHTHSTHISFPHLDINLSRKKERKVMSRPEVCCSEEAKEKGAEEPGIVRQFALC